MMVVYELTLFVHVVVSLLASCLVKCAVSTQKCPASWYGYSLQSKCYRFVSEDSMTWKDARDYCMIRGGDLLRIDSAEEQNWIFTQLRDMQNNSHIPASHWWVGMSNIEYLNKWTWADGAPVGSFIHWRHGKPDNALSEQRCGEVWNLNLFDDAQCSTKYKFICWRDRDAPPSCDADGGWTSTNGACYKVYSQKMKWNAAQHRCSLDGAALVTVDNENDELIIYNYAAYMRQPLWIGLYTKQVGTKAQWMWTNGSPLNTSYWNGTPHVDRTQLDSTCAAVSKALSYRSSWVTSSCNVNRSFICRKPKGSVPSPYLVNRTDHSTLVEVVKLVTCSFDNDICNWHQSTDDNFDWTLISGHTPTTNTGPASDHTNANASGKYLFIETSAPRKLYEKAELISPLIDTWNNNYMCFSMWYYAYGANIGNLTILRKHAKFENKIETVWTNSFQGPSWQHTSVTIFPTGPFQIIIEGTVGDGYLGDLAIDDVEITGGNCSSKISSINTSTIG